MENILVPVVAILFTFGAPALVIIILASLRHRQRIAMIQNGINPDALTISYPGKKSLFWGLLFVGLGLGSIIYGLTEQDHDITDLDHSSPGLESHSSFIGK